MSRERRAAVEAAIPHRDPFLFVDGIVDLGEGYLESDWRVPADAPWFRGHYPGQPILPGVLICEHCIQSGAVLVSRLLGGLDEPGEAVPVLTRIEEARFRRMVRPGERLTTRVELRERLGPAWFLGAHARRGEQSVLRLRFVLSAAAPPPDAAGAGSGEA